MADIERKYFRGRGEQMNKYHNENWIGQKFGNLTVVGFENKQVGETTAWYWIMECDCGNRKVVSPYKAIHGSTTSCGCMKKEHCHMMTEKYRIKHGERGTRLYTIWRGMKIRCFNKNSKDYERYGGRGISICEEWVDDFAAFSKWAIENGYSDDLSIDRIDVDGNYEPRNCRWVDAHAQNTNQRISHNFCYQGKTMNLSDIAKAEKVVYQTLYKWAVRENLPIEEAIEKAKRNK